MPLNINELINEHKILIIDGINYNQNEDKLTLKFIANEFRGYDFEKTVMADIKENLNFIKNIKIYTYYNCLENSDVPKVIEYLKKRENDPMNRIILNCANDFENDKLTFKLTDETLLSRALAKGLNKRYETYMNEFMGLNIKVDFVCEVNETYEDFEALKDEELKAMLGNVQMSIPKKEPKQSSSDRSTSSKGEDIVYKRKIKSYPVIIKGNLEEETIITIEGEAFEINTRELKGGKTLLTFALSDYSDTILCKAFLTPKDAEEVVPNINKASFYKVEGRLRYDTFEKELVLHIMAINKGRDPKKIREDKSVDKRVELHLHSNMSAMDAITGIDKLVKRASDWGHKAIAVTDHGVVQAYPEAMNVGKKHGVKILYGLEGYLINDEAEFIGNIRDYGLKDEYVVFDIETTGLSPVNDRITEIGAVKVRNNQIVDEFSVLIDPEKEIPEKIIELTGISNEMIRGKEKIDLVLRKFLEFVGDAPLVAHNAKFDTSFIDNNARRLGIEHNATVLDTLSLSRALLKELKRHKLNQVAKFLKIDLKNHHRALDDAKATGLIFIKFVEMLEELNIGNLYELSEYAISQMGFKDFDTYHIIIFAKNLEGLKTLYGLISHSHIKTFYKKPRIPKSLLNMKRENLIIGSACEAGEVYQAILNNKEESEIRATAEFYDYLEIQPTGNNQFLIDKQIVTGEEELRDINKKIIRLGDELGKLTVATCDVHFMEPEDEIYRRILMGGQGFSDADNQPPLYLRTTDEMLKEFEYLGKDLARKVVIENTNAIADLMDEFLPIPDGTFPPIIEGSEEELREMCFVKARGIYGDDLPEVVEERLEKELSSIIGNGYAVMYIIAQKLVTKSLSDGYLVGSRGSVGSSFAATMSDITEVNPLPPHYICKHCKTSEFLMDGSLGSGADLPDKTCPNCGADFNKDGHDIPFATFLGFEGDKEPDIDLNFAGIYQATSHKYCEELFGEGYTYKAGTIGTVAEKTAFGFVKKYYEEREEKKNSKEILRLAGGCTGVKRTSGQHPGGIMVIPNYKDVHDFSPIQYPANDPTSGVVTLHFDYHSISGRILKLDILGHDTPTEIRMLEDLTGINSMEIPLDDRDTVAIFTGTKTLNIVDKDYDITHGSLAIPEFGTKFVRQMLDDTQPSTFAELVRISGLSHGTDVWLNNAQDMVRAGICQLKDVISTRDDIMVYLMYAGLPPKTAFTIMENVRKGKGLKEEQETLMRENKVPEWYIESCKKIKYMFPKAHAVAYVMMSFRIAYFKVHYPLEFYSTFFFIKVDDFDAELVSKGKIAINQKLKELDSLQNMSQKEKDSYTINEVVKELFARGFEIMKVDLYKSEAELFKIVDGKILPPLRGLQGVGENAAKAIVEARELGEFLSIADLKKKAKATRTVIEALQVHGCLEGLPEDNQLSIFDF